MFIFTSLLHHAYFAGRLLIALIQWLKILMIIIVKTKSIFLILLFVRRCSMEYIKFILFL